MNQSLLFSRQVVDTEKLIRDFSLHLILENDRTAIYESSDVRVSIDEKVIRVLVFNGCNYDLVQRVKDYFYGNGEIV